MLLKSVNVRFHFKGISIAGQYQKEVDLNGRELNSKELETERKEYYNVLKRQWKNNGKKQYILLAISFHL